MEEGKQEQPDKNFKGILRLANTDIDGNRKLYDALRTIKGVSFSLANAICGVVDIDRTKKAGNLLPDEIKKINDAIEKVNEKIPTWLLNRRRNPEDGSDKHLIAADLTFAQENDVRMMMHVRSYKGVRHAAGAPVRGQKTRSNFRRNKGKVIGVIKRKMAATSGSGAGSDDDKGKGKVKK
jgi:small subunit ribosomal protein S13